MGVEGVEVAQPTLGKAEVVEIRAARAARARGAPAGSAPAAGQGGGHGAKLPPAMGERGRPSGGVHSGAPEQPWPQQGVQGVGFGSSACGEHPREHGETGRASSRGEDGESISTARKAKSSGENSI